MATSRISKRILLIAVAAALTVAAAFGMDTAHASQGPGGGLGTANNLTQVGMAVIVWGISALVVCAGLIGAVRGR